MLVLGAVFSSDFVRIPPLFLTKTLFMKALVCSLLLMCFCLPVFAKQITGIYDSKVMVPDQLDQSRLGGAQQGMLEVLQKVSGFPVDSEQPVVAKALKIADQYLYQFSYEKADPKEGQVKAANWLKMRFEGKAIQRIVRQASLPRWGTNRPTVLVWLAIDDGQRQIIADGHDHPAYAGLQDAAQRRGIPVIFPVYDLEDSIKLPMEQLWGMFSEGVVTASDRYGAESILMARVVGRTNEETGQTFWQGRWRFIFRNKEYDYEFLEEDLDTLVLSGLTAGAQVLANAFALKSTGLASNELRMDVSGINNLNQYAAVLKYLEKLAITKQVGVAGINNKTVAFDLNLNGSFNKLQQILALDKRLVEKTLPQVEQEEQGAEYAPEDDGVVEFVWRP